jgi:ribosomal protein S18 acetylase RimI-like enzyme
MQITLAEPIELIDIVEIDKEVIGSDNRTAYLKIAIKEKRCLVTKIDASIVGFLIYNTDFFDCSFIALVIVHPLERNKGYAKSMMEYFEKVSPTPKVFSSTNQSNENMQKLFDSIGYVKSGFVENLDAGDPEIIYYKNVCVV